MLVVTMTDGTRYATRTLPGDTGKPDAFAQGPAWTDAHIPRTEKPVRFNGPHGCTFKDGHHESYPSFVDRCPI